LLSRSFYVSWVDRAAGGAMKKVKKRKTPKKVVGQKGTA
jgi:hypothetical protein